LVDIYVNELWPYVLPLPKRPFDQYKVLLSAFSSELSLEILKQASSGRPVFQSELLHKLPYSSKTILGCLNKLVSSGVLESGMDKKRSKGRLVWVKWYKPTALGRWFGLLLLPPKKVSVADASRLLSQIFGQYSRNVAKLSSRLSFSASSLLSEYHGAYVSEVVSEHKAAARDLDIVVFGSVAMDQVVPVEDFALGETTPVGSLYQYPGGSGATVAVGLSRLGLVTGFAGRIGCDFWGQRLVEEILKENVDLSQLVPSEQLETLRTIIMVDKEGRKRMIVPTTNVAISLDSPSQIEWRRIEKASAIYLGETFVELAELIAGHAKSQGKPVFYRLLSPFAKFGMEKLLGILKSVKVTYMNEQGWNRLSEVSPRLSDPANLLEAGPDIVSVTKNRQGCSVYTKQKKIEVKAPVVKSIDSTGAGDAFAAAFTKLTLDGRPVEEAARYACAAAALSTTKRGAWASMPRREEISRFMGAM